MTDNRQFSDRTYLAIKAAFRDLVNLAGGPKRAADKIRGCQSRISEAMAPQCMDRFPGVDQIADLESDTGEITVTRLLADMAGYDLVPRVVKASTDGILDHMAMMSIEAGKLQGEMIKAMADGGLSPEECRHLLTAIGKHSDTINSMRALVEKAAEAR